MTSHQERFDALVATIWEKLKKQSRDWCVELAPPVHARLIAINEYRESLADLDPLTRLNGLEFLQGIIGEI